MGSRFGRSRWRLGLAVACLVAAALAVGLVYVPGEWLARAGDAIQAATAYLLSFGARSLLFAAGGVLIVSAALLVVLPRRRPHAYWAGWPSTIAPISVYVDAENQATSPEDAQALIGKVRELISDLRKEHRKPRTDRDQERQALWADLIYFTDVTRTARASLHRPKDKYAQERWEAYRSLYRFGFRPVDVSHRPVGKSTAENVVDVELALYAYQRALFGPPHQVIVLVANDGDYYPLIYRLRALGHSVHVWGTSLAQAYKELEEVVGIETRLYGTPDISRLNGNEQAPAASARAHPAPQLSPVKPEAIAILSEAIAKTISILEGVSEPDQDAAQRFELVKRDCSKENDIPLQMGIKSTTRLAVWLWLLTALGALKGNSISQPLEIGPEPALTAAQKLERLLSETSAVARAIANTADNDRKVRLRTLWQQLCQIPQASSDISLVDMQDALQAVKPVDSEHYALTLCRCARKVGLLRFKELTGGTIQILLDTQQVNTLPARVLDASQVDIPDEGEPVATISPDAV